MVVGLQSLPTLEWQKVQRQETLDSKIKTVFHSNPVVNTQIKFQSLQLVLATIVLLLVYLLNPENFVHFFRAGDINAHISKIYDKSFLES